MAPKGVAALIHLESHFTDEKAGLLRSEAYKRLRRHWQFVNELELFEIQHQKIFGVSVYGAADLEVDFLQGAWLYHPETVERSFVHDGSGDEPGLKDDDGNWDLRPHASRISRVTASTLAAWNSVLETEDTPIFESRMLYTVNRSAALVLNKVAQSPRIGDLGLTFSRGWDESRDFKRGIFLKEWGKPAGWHEAILQGPHMYVGNPSYKQPNETMEHHLDWTPVDLEALPTDYVPVTSYKRRAHSREFLRTYPEWSLSSEGLPTEYFRIAWRRMAANTGERTLYPALFPPGPTFIQTVGSAAAPSPVTTALALSTLQSLIADFAVRALPKNDILFSTIARLPTAASALEEPLLERTLRLNCVSSAFAPLWNSSGLGLGEWSSNAPARTALKRRQLQVEIDALVALGLGVTADELCTVYRTQFAVLRKYDQENHYDANGRLVPNEVMKLYKAKGENLTEEERTATHPGSGIDYTYEFPFVVLDREADMRAAYAKFEEEFGSPA